MTAYVKNSTWVDGAGGGTPLSAARLNHMEDGISGAEDRANHRGTQLSATISDLPEAVQDLLAAALVQGSKIVISYNDALGQVTIATTALGPNGNTVTLTGATQQFGAFTINDDGTATSGWPNRWEFFFSTGGVARHTFYLNEYGEIRVSPAKPTTTPMRVFTKEFASDPARSNSVPLFDIMDNRDNRNILAAFYADGRFETVSTVKASNLPPSILAQATAPTSPVAGQVWIDTSA